MSESPDVKNIMKAIDLAIMAQVNMQLTLFDANKLKVHIDALNAEIAELKDQLRWRNTIDEQPTYLQEVLVRPRIVERGISTFIYFDQFAEMFKRDYVEWLPMPEVVR